MLELGGGDTGLPPTIYEACSPHWLNGTDFTPARMQEPKAARGLGECSGGGLRASLMLAASHSPSIYIVLDREVPVVPFRMQVDM